MTHRRRSGHEVDFPCLLCRIAALLLAFTMHAPAVADSRTAVSCGFHYTVLEDGTVSISQYEGDAEPLVIPATLDGRTVTVIGLFAFWNCASLTSVMIPASVTVLGLFNCRAALTSVTIPAGVTLIGEGTFCQCASLQAIALPDAVKEIGDMAFAECATLEAVNIPASVTSIGDSAFGQCPSLTLCIADNAMAAQYARGNGIPCTTGALPDWLAD